MNGEKESLNSLGDKIMAGEVKKVGISLPGGEEVQVTLTKDGERWKIDHTKLPKAPGELVVKSGGSYVGIVNPGMSGGTGQVVGTFWQLNGDTFRPVDPGDKGAQGLARSMAKGLEKPKGPFFSQPSPGNDLASTRSAPGPLGNRPDNTMLTLKGPVTLTGSPVPFWELLTDNTEGSRNVTLILGDERALGGRLRFYKEGTAYSFGHIELTHNGKNLTLSYDGALSGDGVGWKFTGGGRDFFLFEAYDGTLVLTDGQGMKGLASVKTYSPYPDELKYAHLLGIDSDVQLGRVQLWASLAENFSVRSWPPLEFPSSDTPMVTVAFADLGANHYQIPMQNQDGRWVLAQNHGRFNGHEFYVPNPNQNLAVVIGPAGPFSVLLEPGRGHYEARINRSAFHYAYNRHFQNPNRIEIKNLFDEDRQSLLDTLNPRDFNSRAAAIGKTLRRATGRRLAFGQSRWLPSNVTFRGKIKNLNGTTILISPDHPGFSAEVSFGEAVKSDGELFSASVMHVPVKGPDGLSALLLPREGVNQGDVPGFGFIAETGDGRPVLLDGKPALGGYTLIVTSDRPYMDRLFPEQPGLIKRLLNETDGFTTLTHEEYVEHCHNTGAKPLSAKSSGLYGGMTVAMGTGWAYETALTGLERISGHSFSQNVHTDWAQLPIGLASALFATHYSGGKVSFRNGLGGFVRGNILANPIMELTRQAFQPLFGGSALVSAANFGLGFWVNQATDFIIDRSPYKKLFTTLGYLSLAASLVVDENSFSDFSSTLSTYSQPLKSVVNSLV